MIPADPGAHTAAGFIAGVVVGGVGTGLIVWLRCHELGRVAEQNAWLRGRNVERVLHGEEQLHPPPYVETELELWKFGIGSDQPPDRRSE